MNKKAFVLMETIVVIVVISIALLTIFRSYNKILAKVKTENKYDTSEYIYMTKYIKDYLVNEHNNSNEVSIFNMSTSSNILVNHFTSEYNFTVDNHPFKIKKIYIINNVNATIDENLKKFDAYMIDYIKKLDVGDKDEIIIVEYYKNALDDKGEFIYTTNCPEGGKDKNNKDCLPLQETYIASLEWN